MSLLIGLGGPSIACHNFQDLALAKELFPGVYTKQVQQINGYSQASLFKMLRYSRPSNHIKVRTLSVRSTMLFCVVHSLVACSPTTLHIWGAIAAACVAAASCHCIMLSWMLTYA